MNHVKFAPELFMTDVKSAIAFYEKAFGARELRRFSNEDGSVHVAEM
jgi:PhnB protein